MTRRSAALQLILALSFCQVALAQHTGTFTPTGNMTTARVGHTVTLLTDGKVLITGGATPNYGDVPPFSSAELYDPSTGSFTATGNMTTGRSGHTATLLPDGKVLIAGGVELANRPPGVRAAISAELYDPTTGTFSATGNMAVAGWCSAILLNDGTVLIAHNNRNAELYYPATGTFSGTGNQSIIPSGIPIPTLLSDGRVLLVTGSFKEEQLYDPATATFSLTDRAKGIFPDGFAEVPLADGTVLFSGGMVGDYDLVNSGAGLYDPSSGTFRLTGNMTIGRYYHTATPLPDGTVLIAGGDGDPHSNPAANTSAEIYDPATGAFSRTGDMTSARSDHTATLLLDGTVLLTSGGFSYPIAAGAEVYTPSVLVPIPIVRAIRFDRMVVPAGSAYSVDLSGSNLTPEMFFDVRFNGPESNQSMVALNWQNGLAENHQVPAGLASGSWTITGVRAHKIETDHTGNFFPVSATITVSP
jgi:Galactose oxidase, central domain